MRIVDLAHNGDKAVCQHHLFLMTLRSRNILFFGHRPFSMDVIYYQGHAGHGHGQLGNQWILGLWRINWLLHSPQIGRQLLWYKVYLILQSIVKEKSTHYSSLVSLLALNLRCLKFKAHLRPGLFSNPHALTYFQESSSAEPNSSHTTYSFTSLIIETLYYKIA